jgi:hypothetical protein
MPRKKKLKAQSSVQPAEEEMDCETNEPNFVSVDVKLYLLEEVANLLRELRLAHEEYQKSSRRR